MVCLLTVFEVIFCIRTSDSNPFIFDLINIHPNYMPVEPFNYGFEMKPSTRHEVINEICLHS